MEDALVQMRSALMTQHSKVLILVLMEDALVQVYYEVVR